MAPTVANRMRLVVSRRIISATVLVICASGVEAAVNVEGQRCLSQLGVENGDQIGHRPYRQELPVGKWPVEPADQPAEDEGVQQKNTEKITP